MPDEKLARSVFRNTRRVAKEIPYRDARPRQRHLLDVLPYWVVNAELALFAKHHHCRRNDGLADRGDFKSGLLHDRLLTIDIGIAIGSRHRDLPFRDDDKLKS